MICLKFGADKASRSQSGMLSHFSSIIWRGEKKRYGDIAHPSGAPPPLKFFGRNLTFSILDHLSSTSFAKLKYLGTSLSPRLMASKSERLRDVNSLAAWGTDPPGFLLLLQTDVSNLWLMNKIFMAEWSLRWSYCIRVGSSGKEEVRNRFDLNGLT